MNDNVQDNKNLLINQRIYLRSSKVSGLHESFHFFLENFLLLKFVFFKNRPRNNYLLIRSFLLTALYFGAYYQFVSRFQFIFLGIDVDPILLFSATGIIGYFAMTFFFSQKSNYCFNLYNRIIEEQARGEYKVADALACNLAGQLLSLDLWGHRIFGKFFTETIQNAVNLYHEGKLKWDGEESAEELAKKINGGEARIGDLRKLFWSYQDYLLKK